MRTIRVFSSIILVIFLLANCSEETNSFHASIPRERFVQLYIDVLLAGESGRLSAVDSSRMPRTSVLDSLYQKYEVTESQVKQTIDEYSKDLRRWKEFYDEVIQRLEALQREEKAKKQS